VIAVVSGIVGLVFFFSYILTNHLCSGKSEVNFLDCPNQRSLHLAPVPRTGGIAILVSFFTGLLLLILFIEVFNTPPLTASSAHILSLSNATGWILGISLLLGAVSFRDDRRSVSPLIRLGWHTLAAAGIIFGAGLSINSITVPLLGRLSLEWLAIPFTLLFMVWMTNLYNFMDGIDGFASGMTSVGFGFLSFVAWMGDHLVITSVSLFIAAASVGFLFFNLPPAKIFMGDVGSVPLGFLAGTLSVMGVHDGLFDIWIPMLIFSPFIVDATLTLFIRLFRGEKVWHAHRQHYYQRMVLAGWGHRRTLVAEYCLMLACGTSAILYWTASEPFQLALLLAWSAAYSLLAFSVKAFETSSSAELRGCPRGQS